ncbi:hypothetical protein L211DRAFT_776273 [Terfezia boudieri ATCC MYA-4762]|uniref:Mitochondrial distribution and morphology protein 10 n=1 Tax=Terfezia boudieri ATCC MYA-4762 TaxID=1051890 RepID=A0A3N4MBX0_9PEZI|nr:hypothetical protein L211DRAFT_776273 [Terfezia boudieri ATCC MYA-4762]
MLTYMDYVQQAFYKATNWNEDNSYANLTATARALLDFHTPRGLNLHLSSLSSPNFATSYSLTNLGVVDGSISYLYSSLPLTNVHKSRNVYLHDVVQGYRQLRHLVAPSEARFWEVWQGGVRVDTRDSLLYGRMYLPISTLEMLYLRRHSPKSQLRIAAVSDAKLKNGGTILAVLQQDVGKYSTECLYSTSEGLIGARGLYNFGYDPRQKPKKAVVEVEKLSTGRLSMGAEVYYGVLNKSGGMSTAIRYTTLPHHPGPPLTMTLTLSPLMGHFSATYAIKAGPNAAFCSRFDFNMYSYESDLVVGCELWQRKPTTSATAQLRRTEKDAFTGVLKARWTQSAGLGVLWEGRVKHLLFSLGANIDFRRREGVVKGVGVEVQYSS